MYIASRKLPELEKVAEQMNKLSPAGAVKGPAVIPLQADVGSKAGCDALAQQIKDKETELDIVSSCKSVERILAASERSADRNLCRCTCPPTARQQLVRTTMLTIHQRVCD